VAFRGICNVRIMKFGDSSPSFSAIPAAVRFCCAVCGHWRDREHSLHRSFRKRYLKEVEFVSVGHFIGIPNSSTSADRWKVLQPKQRRRPSILLQSEEQSSRLHLHLLVISYIYIIYYLSNEFKSPAGKALSAAVGRESDEVFISSAFRDPF
jgi:hypothetical protein